MSTYIPLMLGK